MQRIKRNGKEELTGSSTRMLRPEDPTRPNLLTKSTLQNVEGEIFHIMEGVPSSHGQEHIRITEQFGEYLSIREGSNLLTVKLAVLLHDIRWFEGPERNARKLKTVEDAQAAQFPTAEQILEKILQQKQISSGEYNTVKSAVEVHSNLPEKGRVRDLTTRCLADADRLSRSGFEGLLSTLQANYGYHTLHEQNAKLYKDVPLYKNGDEIERAFGSPMISNKQIHSGVNDINSCLDWETIMETKSGQGLITQLNKVNRQWLKVFKHYVDIGQPLTDYLLWIDYLKSIIGSEQYKQKREEVNNLLKEGNIANYEKELITLQNPQMISIESFESFRKQRQIK